MSFRDPQLEQSKKKKKITTILGGKSTFQAQETEEL